MKSQKSFSIVLVLALFVMPLLTACGPQKVSVILETYKMTLSTYSVPAGKVAFHITNAATDQKHEFLVFKTDLPVDQLPTTPDGKVDESSTTAVKVFDSGELDPGKSVDMTQDFVAGNYVVICNMLEKGVSHYQQGMRAAFTIK
jgi:uncharacterized cupredoxin-like copper-binding protein